MYWPLQNVVMLEANGKTKKACIQIFNIFTSWLEKGEFLRCEALLAAIRPEEFSVSFLVTVYEATREYSNELDYHYIFTRLVKESLHRRGVEVIERDGVMWVGQERNRQITMSSINGSDQLVPTILSQFDIDQMCAFVTKFPFKSYLLQKSAV